MSKSDQTDQIATALAAAQAEMKAAHMDKQNPHFKNRYASLASVIDATREPLAKNGLSITQTTGCYLPNDGTGVVFFALTTVLMHKSGQWISSDYPLPAGAKPQELGSALTYGRRYCWSSICGISADEDDDAEATRKAKGDDEGVVGRALAAVEAREARKGEKPPYESQAAVAARKAAEKGPLDD